MAGASRRRAAPRSHSGKATRWQIPPSDCHVLCAPPIGPSPSEQQEVTRTCIWQSTLRPYCTRTDSSLLKAEHAA